jgi:hypothetical protein
LVVGISTEAEEIRGFFRRDQHGFIPLASDPGAAPWDTQSNPFVEMDARKWKTEASELEGRYLRGRGVPGSGGLDIGTIVVRLRVLPLQGMRTDPETYARRKVFGNTEADVPLQLALWNAPAVDPRFQESVPSSLSRLFPVGSEVVGVEGKVAGLRGVVLGAGSAAASNVDAAAASSTTASVSGRSLKQEIASKSKTSKGPTLTVEFFVDINPEPLFGYSIAATVVDEYFGSREVCQVLKISSQVLGMITGSVFVEPGRIDLGFNLKRTGQYQLPGYARKVDESNSLGTVSCTENSGPGVSAWGQGDTVQIIGTVNKDDEERDDRAYVQWEFSARTIALLVEYQSKFPLLFSNLAMKASLRRFTANDLFGAGGTKEMEKAVEWLKGQPFVNLPRIPLTTLTMSR